jgi:hypothetical protein
MSNIDQATADDDVTYEEFHARLEAMVRAGLIENTGRVGKKYRGLSNEERRLTSFGRRLQDRELLDQLVAAAMDPDPDVLQKFFVSHKAQLDHYRN